MTSRPRPGASSDPPGDQPSDDLFRAFVEIDELRNTIADLGTKHDVLMAAVATLRARVDVIAEGVTAARPRVWWWPDLTAEEARIAWEALTTWMQDALVVRYPDMNRVLTPCWFRHPAAVDTLTSLYTTWLAAYRDPAAEPTAAAAWLHQWLPAAVTQVKQALRSCDWNAHREDRTQQEHVGNCFGDDLSRFVVADIAQRDTPD